MKPLAVLMAAAVLIGCLSAASANLYPNYDGATGVVALPTAKTAAPGTINLAVSYQQFPEPSRYYHPRANAAIGNSLEVWGGKEYWRSDSTYNVDDVTCGAKVRLLKQEQSGVDLAVGGSYTWERWSGPWSDKANYTKGFVAVTKDFDLGSAGVTGRVTAGGLYFRSKYHDWKDSFTRPYAAVELLDIKGFDIGMEYRQSAPDSMDYETAIWSVVARYTVPEKPVWVELGSTNAPYLGLSGKGGQCGFFGVGVAFGGE